MIKIAATTGTALRSTDYTDFSSILPLQKFPSFALLLLLLPFPLVSIIHAASVNRDEPAER